MSIEIEDTFDTTPTQKCEHCNNQAIMQWENDEWLCYDCFNVWMAGYIAGLSRKSNTNDMFDWFWRSLTLNVILLFFVLYLIIRIIVTT